MSDYDVMALLRRVAPLSRTLVHEDNERALQMIGEALPAFGVERFPSGRQVWTWRVPDRWRVKEARLEDAATGELLWDGLCHPLATVNYSLPFDGVVDREVLASHLFSAPQRPRAIPFVYRFFNRDWGLCVPDDRRATILERQRFGVRIVTDEGPGDLLVGICTLPGEREEEFLVVSDICHPGIANDSISGAVAAVDLARHLAARRRRKYTYRFLFLPETIGSVAYLSHHPEVVERAVGGFFCEMLGNRNSHCLQFTRQGNTYWDRIAHATLKDAGGSFRTAPFLKSAANDEKVLDAPGVNIPTISLTRYPYPEYHTSDDNADMINPALLRESCRLIRTLFERIEDDYVPRYLQRGPVCLSENGLYPDWYRDPSLVPVWEGFLKVMYALDDRRSCEDLAADLDVPVAVVRYWADAFIERGFAEARPRVVRR